MPTCPQCLTGYPADATVCPLDGTSLGFGPSDATGARDRLGFPRERRRGDAPDPLLGTTLAGRFRLDRRIGEGGMGVVYEATHTVIGKPVALKVLHERFVDRPEVAARLMNEARLASAIRNDHIVDIFDFGETGDGRTFVVMELLEGESLAQLIRSGGPLPEARAVRVALQVCDALQAAHQAGIIHRDVKPENVFLLRRDGEDFAKVLDFGISKAMQLESSAGSGEGDEAGPLRLTHTGMVLGTPMYMSPEQARGEERIDHRIDVYALGVILYEALTGEVPFSGTNYLNILAEVMGREAVPPREVRPDLSISPALEQVVQRAMARDRGARYPTMAALAEDLRRVQQGGRVEPFAHLSQRGEAAASRGQSSRSALSLYVTIGALAVALLLVTVFLARSAPPAEAPRTAAAAPAPHATAPPAATPAATPPSGAAPANAAAATPVKTVLAQKNSPVSPEPAAAKASPVVHLRVSSTPPGATVSVRGRTFGRTPCVVALPRSERPVRLSFHLEGHQDSVLDVVPQTDGEQIPVELARRKPARRSHLHSKATGAEVLPAPNPYH